MARTKISNLTQMEDLSSAQQRVLNGGFVRSTFRKYYRIARAKTSTGTSYKKMDEQREKGTQAWN